MISKQNNKKNNNYKSLTHKTLSGMLWVFSGKGIQIILRIIVLSVLARILSPNDFGVIGVALIVISFSEIFTQFGLGPAIIQRPSIEQEHVRTAFTITVILGVLISLIVFLAAPFVSVFFQMDQLTSVIRILSLIFTIKGLSIVSEALLQRELKFEYLAVIEVVSYVLGYALIGITLAYMDLGVWSLAVAHLSQNFLKCVLLLAIHPHSKKPLYDSCTIKELLNFGGGLSLARISNFFALQGDNLIIGRFLGADALGLYGRAYQLMAVPATLLGQVIDKVLFSGMSKIQHEKERLAFAYERGVALIALTVLPVSVLSIIVAPELINLLLGSGWEKTIFPFQIMAVGMLFRISYKVSASLARAKGNVYHLAWRQGVYAFLVISGAWVGHFWGINGIAVGVLVALTVMFILMAHLSLYLTSISWKKYIIIQCPAFLLSGLIGLFDWGIVALMRNLYFSPILIVNISALLVFALASILLRVFPNLFLRDEGKWVLKMLNDFMPYNIKCIINKIFLIKK